MEEICCNLLLSNQNVITRVWFRFVQESSRILLNLQQFNVLNRQNEGTEQTDTSTDCKQISKSTVYKLLYMVFFGRA